MFQPTGILIKTEKFVKFEEKPKAIEYIEPYGNI